MPNLTDRAVRNLPEGTHWDAALKGFGLRVGKGRRTWIVLIASGRRKRIGHYPDMKLAEARQEAKEHLARKTLGHRDPVRTAFEDAREEFLADCDRRLRPLTLRLYRRLLTRHFLFGRQAIADVTPRQIITRLHGLPPAEKEHAFRVGRTFFNWAIRNHLLDLSPMARMAPPPASKSRERVLSEDELKAVYQAARAGDTAFHRIVALLVLTGQRRGEIAGLQWAWFDGDTITLPSSVTKNGRIHSFPVGKQAQAVMERAPRLKDSPYIFPAARQKSDASTVFNGWGKPKAAFDLECGVTGWTLHDLRRTLASFWAAPPLSVQQVVVEKYLNHVSGGSQSPIAQIYNRHRYIDEMREAALKWEAYLATLTHAR